MYMDMSHVLTTLKSAGLRATPQRIALLNVLGAARSPLSVEQIHKLLQPHKVDTVTIYRSLERFVSVGIARRAHIGGDHAHFELHDEHDHHHLVCLSCGKTEDFTGCHIETLSARALRGSTSFTSVTEHSLELFGMCNSCSR